MSLPSFPVEPSATDLTGLLAEPARLRTFAAVALGAGTAADVAERAGVDLREAARALARLAAAGVLTEEDGRYRVNTEGLREAARSRAHSREEFEGEHAEDARVLRSFFRGDRLVSIPAQWSKRLVVLDRIAQEFQPGVRYPEKVVNEMLHGFHDDHAALRRYLIEDGFLEREAGVYWRSGGRID